jgi:hypothetical protein
VSWKIFAMEASQPDLDSLSEEERSALSDDLFGWVDAGPPRTSHRRVGGLDLFEDVVESGFKVTYFVDEASPYAAILRVRKT